MLQSSLIGINDDQTIRRLLWK